MGRVRDDDHYHIVVFAHAQCLTTLKMFATPLVNNDSKLVKSRAIVTVINQLLRIFDVSK